MFEIVSFGTDYSISSNNRTGYENTDENIKIIKEEIDNYSSNMGGTNIFEPLNYIIEKYLIDFSFIPKEPYKE